MSSIRNAAPIVLLQGIQDVSGRAPVITPEELPTHLPLVHLFCQKGPTLPQLVSGDSFTSIYGAKTLDSRSDYYNHASVFAERFQARANSFFTQRLKPADAATARLLFSLDIVADQIQQYQRNSDGTFKLDTNGAKIPVTGAGATLPGFKAKWVINQWATTPSVEAFGEVAQRVGSLVATDSTQSTLYPMFELELSSFGSYGNNVGARLIAPTTASSDPASDSVANALNAFLYRLQLVARDDVSSTPVITQTLGGDQYVEFTFKPGAIYLNTDTVYDIESIFLDAYQDLGTPGVPPTYGPFSQLHVYDANITAILAMVGAAEAPQGLLPAMTMDATSPYLYMVNPFTGVNLDNVPYYTLEVLGSADGGTLFTENTTVYAEGGADGAMDFDTYDTLVQSEFTNFGSAEAALLNDAKYPLSAIWDPGHTLDTKLAMISVLGKRKDVAVFASTQDLSQPQNTDAVETSMAIALLQAMRLYPEATMFGTSVCRGVVVGQSGKLLNSNYTGLVPLNLELADKVANYMGAGDGVWKSGLGFDVSPNNQITLFKTNTVNSTYKSATARNKDWSNGLVWAQDYDRSSLFFPAVQTVYDDDSSVLNSAINMLVMVECEKVAQRVWRDLTGNATLTADQFKKRSNDLITAQVQGRFDNRFTIVPETYYTSGDAQRGYSWSCKIHVYAPNMKTVGTFTIVAHRQSDLTAAA